MKYLFILGRNIKLSTAEVLSYLKRKNNSAKSFLLRRNGLIVEVEKELDEKAIDYFGGIISIGEVLIEDNLEKNLEKIELYSGVKNNFNYALWDFADEQTYEGVSLYLKSRFKQEKYKASQKNLSGTMKLQSGKIVQKISSRVVEEKYFVFEEKLEEDKKSHRTKFFGKIIAECDYDELEKRDMGKPVRREELAISPRLSKIMINLSEVRDGPLIDAFCGIGVILSESLLQNIPVIGIDRDDKAIVGARKNLAWGKFNQRDYQLFANNSKTVRTKEAEVLVSEPDLGKTWKKVPTDGLIKHQMMDFEDLMIAVLNNFKQRVSRRFVFTGPFILTKKKGRREGCNIERILEATKLKLVEGTPIPEFREGQIVGREVFILEK